MWEGSGCQPKRERVSAVWLRVGGADGVVVGEEGGLEVRRGVRRVRVLVMSRDGGVERVGGRSDDIATREV